MRKAFTMVEMVFVIVILGIFAAIAVPKFAATRDDAHIAKGRADVAAIRSGIVTERQERLLRGDSAFITPANLSTTKLFDGVLMYGITSNSADGHWTGGGTSYTYHLKTGDVTFTYDQANGTFTCSTGGNCSQLTD